MDWYRVRNMGLGSIMLAGHTGDQKVPGLALSQGTVR